MTKITENEVNYDKLASVIFSKKEPFKLSDIVDEIGFTGDEHIVKNSALIQQGSSYFSKNQLK